MNALEYKKTAICIASGPSVTPQDIEYCRGKGKIYVINEMIFTVPFADVLYAADPDWWNAYRGCQHFDGEKWTQCLKTANKWNLNHIQLDRNALWSNTPGVIASGRNSGFQALNFAVLCGAEKVVLLGYDMGSGPAQQKHSFDNELTPKIIRESNYPAWIKHFHKAAPQIPVPVYNASQQSKLECFEKVNLKEII